MKPVTPNRYHPSRRLGPARLRRDLQTADGSVTLSKHPKQHQKTRKRPLANPLERDYSLPSFLSSLGRLAVPHRVRTAVTEQNLIMAVRIRLKRVGTKNKPAFRIVVADNRSPRDGKCIEEIGTYLPLKRGNDNFTLKLDRAQYWLGKGAQPSETVAAFIKKATRTVPAVAAEPQPQPQPA
jgi:small subunit ribosomal protein S16